MNKTNVIRLADHIEAMGNIKWSMDRYRYTGGASMFLQYHTRVLHNDVATFGEGPVHRASRVLGLNKFPGQAPHLFTPIIDYTGYNYKALWYEPGFITHLHVVRCLHHLANTGIVEWIASFPYDEHVTAEHEGMRADYLKSIGGKK